MGDNKRKQKTKTKQKRREQKLENNLRGRETYGL